MPRLNISNKNFRIALGLMISIFFFYRLYYAFIYQWHWLSPDQLAWEIGLLDLLKNGNWSYRQLIHYPHEGGSILISFLALPFKHWFPFSSLSVVALLLHTVFFGAQLWVVNYISDKKTALLFGLYSLVSLPILISWSGVNYGLHALAGVFPFLFWMLISYNNSSKGFYFFSGALLAAFAACFYSNFLFVPIFLVVILSRPNALKNGLRFLAGFTTVIVLHFAVRQWFNPGFELGNFESSSIRGEQFEPFNPDSYDYLFEVWHNILPASTLLSDPFWGSDGVFQAVWLVIVLAGTVLFVAKAPKAQRSGTWAVFIFIVLFVEVYSASPFYLKDSAKANYVLSRHLTYVLPILGAAAIVGWLRFRNGIIAVFLLILVSLIGSVQMWSQAPVDEKLWRETGWVMSAKYGGDLNKALELFETAPAENERREMIIGLGWGTCTHLLYPTKDSIQLKRGMEQLENLVQEIDGENRKLYVEGVYYSFSPNVHPRLDSNLIAGFSF